MIQYNENLNTHTCSFLNTMSKYMHTYKKHAYACTDVSKYMHMYKFIRKTNKPDNTTQIFILPSPLYL